MELLTDPQLWVAFASLLPLEIVLGIDNVVFISILADKLPTHQQTRARIIGLLLALGDAHGSGTARASFAAVIGQIVGSTSCSRSTR